MDAAQDDEDGHLVVLIIIEELMTKTKDEFLDHFARLGIFSKVQGLMGNADDNSSDVIKSSSSEGGSSSIPSLSLVKGNIHCHISNKEENMNK